MECKICGGEIEDEDEEIDGFHRNCLEESDLASDVVQAIPFDD